jgi:hypothetical protein
VVDSTVWSSRWMSRKAPDVALMPSGPQMAPSGQRIQTASEALRNDERLYANYSFTTQRVHCN